MQAALAAKRAQRQGGQTDNPDFGRKPCHLCLDLKDLLIR